MATYAIAQETHHRTPIVTGDAKLKEAGLTRVHMIDSAIQMLDHFVTAWPEDPAGFAFATALIDLSNSTPRSSAKTNTQIAVQIAS